VLAVQGIGHQDATPAVGQVLLVNALDLVVVGTPWVGAIMTGLIAGVVL